MRDLRLKSVIAAATAFALCASPTIAAAPAAAPVQTLNPLVAVSVFGTQASAQTVCAQTASVAAAAGLAAEPGQGGCVLPVGEAGPTPPQADALPAPAIAHGFGISPVLLGLLGIAALAALIASQGDDNANNLPGTNEPSPGPLIPVSPS